MAPGFWVSRPPVQEFHDSFQLDEIGQTVQKEHLNAPYWVWDQTPPLDYGLSHPIEPTTIATDTPPWDIPNLYRCNIPKLKAPRFSSLMNSPHRWVQFHRFGCCWWCVRHHPRKPSSYDYCCWKYWFRRCSLWTPHGVNWSCRLYC